MIVPGYRDHPSEDWDTGAPADPDEAEDFLRQCYLENPRLGPVEPRLAIVHKRRKVLSSLESSAALDLLLDRLKQSRTNIEFLMQIAKSTPGE